MAHQVSDHPDVARVQFVARQRLVRVELNDSGHERLKSVSHIALAASIRKSLGDDLDPRYNVEFAVPCDSSIDFVQGDEWPQVLSMQRAKNGAELNIWVRRELAWFQGHFPGHPVLAGVVQTHWVCVIAHHLFGFNADCEAIENLKFQRIIEPQTQLLLCLEYSSEKHRIVFRYCSKDGDCSKGRIRFSP